MRSTTWSRLCLLAVLVVGVVLRARGISGRAFWLDEAFSVRIAQLDWSEVVARSATDNHPPLFFLILKGWMGVFGDSQLALRSLDLIIGVATIGFVYVLARRVLTTTVAAMIAAAWIAIHPTHIAWTAQVRMYALAGLLAVVSALLLLRALEQPTWRRWAAWSGCAIALVYTHYFGAFVVLAQGIHAVVCAVRAEPAERRMLVIRVVAAGALVVAAFAPWIGIVASQAATKAGAWWVPPLSPSRLLWAWSRIPGLLSEDEFHTPEGGWAVVVGVLGCALAAATIIAAAARERGLRLAAWCTVTPLVAGVAASLVIGENIVLARYLIVAEVFAPIVIVGMIYRYVGHRVAAVLLAPLIVCMVRQLPALAPKADVPAGIEWIEEQREPGDIVVVHQFFYWTFRIASPAGDPTIRLYAPNAEPVPFYGASLIDDHDTVWGSADLAKVSGRVFVVDNETFRVDVPPAAGLRGVRTRWYLVTNPDTAVRITLYAASRR
jgi:mannosyltransferase